MNARSIHAAFRDRFTIDGIGCWLWTNSVDTHGYGHLFYDGKLRLAHRLMWELTHGPIPKLMHVLHRCDIPRCINPDHLFLGTASQNMKDMHNKGRHSIRQGCKLNMELANSIRDMPGKHSDIAKRFGVTRPLISAIKRNEIWSKTK